MRCCVFLFSLLLDCCCVVCIYSISVVFVFLPVSVEFDSPGPPQPVWALARSRMAPLGIDPMAEGVGEPVQAPTEREATLLLLLLYWFIDPVATRRRTSEKETQQQWQQQLQRGSNGRSLSRETTAKAKGVAGYYRDPRTIPSSTIDRTPLIVFV